MKLTGNVLFSLLLFGLAFVICNLQLHISETLSVHTFLVILLTDEQTRVKTFLWRKWLIVRHDNNIMRTTAVMMMMVLSVVRRGSERVADCRQLDRQSVVAGRRRRQHAVHRRHVGDQSCAERRLHDVVLSRDSVLLRRSTGHAHRHLHPSTTHDLPLQSDRRTRRPHDRLSDETAQEMARRHQTETGILFWPTLKMHDQKMEEQFLVQRFQRPLQRSVFSLFSAALYWRVGSSLTLVWQIPFPVLPSLPPPLPLPFSSPFFLSSP